ncbi:MAG: 2-oxoglutarate dehydrogenase E1 component [Firmicutes bacterium]|nr:2-oxoglutarate dehydrogenase E1 component [Alicyclobacillaceae bacterium]MCL6497231.1 2-oxoglutarate dehydrogenase E1 component [Bacillota bacterium]
MDGRAVPRDPYQDVTDINRAYLLECYDRYQQDPAAVDPALAEYFARWGPPTWPDAPVQGTDEARQTVADRLQSWADALREGGHRAAAINPLAPPPALPAALDLKTWGITQADLRALPASAIWPEAPPHLDAAQAVDVLYRRYTGPIAFEYRHLADATAREFWRKAVESGQAEAQWPAAVRRTLLYRLLQAGEFERFLHRTYPGQKRFSLEGTDVLVPLLEHLVRTAAETTEIRHVVLAMAHRGRLNVLAHLLGKPYAAIFAEFHHAPDKEAVPSEGSSGLNYGWTGDVRYHLGAENTVEEPNLVEMHLHLAHNPSHLEFVNPVVEGMARALQDRRDRAGAPEWDADRALPVTVHGDAAFVGEGVVAETLNLAALEGYQTGGTIHIVVNNQIGFTTTPEEGRSTPYATDLAKGFEIPVVHVSADDPEACLSAATLALTWRQRFHRDVVIDLVGYRRWGHNEGDDPAPTQPLLYRAIADHPDVASLYRDRLTGEGVVTAAEVEAWRREIQARLEAAYQQTPRLPPPAAPVPVPSDPAPRPPAVLAETLTALNQSLFAVPPEFTLHPRLRRTLERRHDLTQSAIDWGWAEQLAWATLLSEGIAVRLSGQDSQRGTFGQRHAVWHDAETGARYCPLQHLPDARAAFAVYNSPLTETAVLGFEYGYSVVAKGALILWEAQYGDFANVAQVMIDQFIAAGRAKWQQDSALVLLLPHGYEGQGPEHSSARLERFLELSADENWQVVQPTTAAQYFHLLREHAWASRTRPQPLVVLTPKSLLRHPRAGATVAELTGGTFRPLLVDGHDLAQVHQLLVTSGKLGLELAEQVALQPHPEQWAVVRIERLYPFPDAAWRELLAQLPRLRAVKWVQEEPANMGALPFLAPKLSASLPPGVRFATVSRPPRPSPAEGFHTAHLAEAARIVQEALSEL